MEAAAVTIPQGELVKCVQIGALSGAVPVGCAPAVLRIAFDRDRVLRTFGGQGGSRTSLCGRERVGGCGGACLCRRRDL